jgi:hypothetical protein
MKFRKIFNTMRQTQGPSEEFRARLRESLVVYIKNNPPLPKVTLAKKNAFVFPLRKALTVSLASLLLLCTSATLTVFAAQKALPGDTLYGVKLAVDQLSIAVSNSPDVRIKIADRRLEEVRQVLEEQTSQNDRTQTDIQHALGQYQSNLQNVMVTMNTTSSASSTVSVSTVQDILQKTTDNEKDLEQLLSKSENKGITQDLKSSLRFSQQTVETAHIALKDFEGESNDKDPRDNIHISALHPAPVHHSPATILPSTISRTAPTTSTHQADFQNENSRNNGGVEGQEFENFLNIQDQKPTSTVSTGTTSTTSSPLPTTNNDIHSEWQSQSQSDKNDQAQTQTPRSTSTAPTATTTKTVSFDASDEQQKEIKQTTKSTTTANVAIIQTATSTQAATNAVTGTRHDSEDTEDTKDGTGTKETRD